jgi:hypothetical protein
MKEAMLNHLPLPIIIHRKKQQQQQPQQLLKGAEEEEDILELCVKVADVVVVEHVEGK